MTMITRRLLGTGLAGLAVAGAQTPAAAAQIKRIYIIAIVPDGTGDVYITGDNPSMGPWNPGLVKMYTDGNRRILPYEAQPGDKLEYKFTLGSWSREAIDENGQPYPNFKLVVGDQETYEHQIAGFKGAVADVAVTIGVTVPEGTPTVYITGSTPALGAWKPKAKAMEGAGAHRTFTLKARPGSIIEYKFTLGSYDTEALGEDGKPRTENYRLRVGSQQSVEHAIPGFKHP